MTSSTKVVAAADAHFKAKVELVGAEQFTHFMRIVLLQSLDTHWREHLAALDYLRQGIHLRGYAQKNPKQEYKREAFELFSQLLDVVKLEVTRMLMTVRIQSQDQAAEAAERWSRRQSNCPTYLHARPPRTAAWPQVADTPGSWCRRRAEGRPQRPLPLRLGQKYKHCHGKLSRLQWRRVRRAHRSDTAGMARPTEP